MAVKALLLGVGVASLTACGPQVVFDQDVPLPGFWAYADSVRFRYDIADTSKRYDLQLSLKHTDGFPTQNLYTRFVTTYPDGTQEDQPVSLEVADKLGRWLGDCNGDACTLVLPIQQHAQYPAPGSYGLTLHQYGRIDSLSGLTGLSLRIAVAAAP